MAMQTSLQSGTSAPAAKKPEAFFLVMANAALAILVENGRARVMYHAPGKSPEDPMAVLGECGVEHLAYVSSEMARSLTAGYSDHQRLMLNAMLDGVERERQAAAKHLPTPPVGEVP